MGDFHWVKDTSTFNEDFIKNYSKNSDIRYFFEGDAKYPEQLNKLHNDLPILPEKNEN